MTIETIILIAAFVALVGLITYAMIRTLKRNDQLIEDWNLNSQELKALLKQNQQIGEVFNKIQQPTPDYTKGCNDAPSGYKQRDFKLNTNAVIIVDHTSLLEKYIRFIDHIEGATFINESRFTDWPNFSDDEKYILKEIRNKINSEA